MNSREIAKILIIHFEGRHLKPYKDSAGKWTIGIGHLIDMVHERHLLDPAGITDEECERLFSIDFDEAVSIMKKYLPVQLTDNQKGALVCLIFNLGEGNFSGSSIKKRILAKDFAGAGRAFDLWCKETIPGTKKLRVSPGLVRRRKAERYIFEGNAIDDLRKRNFFIAA